MILGLIKIVFWSSLVALFFGLYKGDALPQPVALSPLLEKEPVQRAVSKAPFDTSVKQTTYHIKPLYRYELWGLVVSMHQADGPVDYVHEEWGDHLNAVDICVVWGKNALSGVYEKINFSSGQWTCYYETSDSAAWERFSTAEISNNHILVDRDDIRARLKELRVGDQIYFSGYLAEYSHDGGFFRGTSTIRSDTGNGACETVFIEKIDILRPGPRHWRKLRWVSGIVLLLSIAGWLLLPDRFHIKNL
ncbi:MAG: hypothetical protein LBB76_07360 [Azoarcus sp.]|nr:hypothetical protein [Azoarcus sp.]